MLDNFVSQVQHEVVQVVEHVSRGFGELLVLAERIASCHNSFRDVARDVVERGYRALEAVGDREWDGGWVLPEAFLDSCGFRVLREHPRFPLLRLDLVERERGRSAASERVALRLPAFQA